MLIKVSPLSVIKGHLGIVLVAKDRPKKKSHKSLIYYSLKDEPKLMFMSFKSPKKQSSREGIDFDPSIRAGDIVLFSKKHGGIYKIQGNKVISTAGNARVVNGISAWHLEKCKDELINNFEENIDNFDFNLKRSDEFKKRLRSV